ncbi:hypothetical protein [Parerythrobacter jejuensis]|uniref:Uncharacterized protein n=1 Tax=Parerythrobacter jejuensis TaxID=795812 RepID=A0A845AM13_9SPHN|nr:hypothetical protein [Parerythrobacter jejuensis]MXP31822.1 hypothetical protein [Parerythrobacter jejuensis]
MQIDPALRALWGDPASQRLAQEHMLKTREAWKATDDVAAILEDLEAFGRGGNFADYPALAALFEPDRAEAFVRDFLTTMCAGLRDTHLGQMPFRHSYSDGYAVMHLARAGRATLALVTLECGSRPAANSIAFTDCERVEIILQGHATGAVVSRDGAGALARSTRSFTVGDCDWFDSVSARLIETVDRSLVSLRLSRNAERPGQSTEYALDDGRVLHRSAGNPEDSRHELMATVLGAMGRADAAPALIVVALSEVAAPLRWQALRQALALDAMAGIKALGEIAARQGDPLIGPSQALRKQLVQDYPQLAMGEAA